MTMNEQYAPGGIEWVRIREINTDGQIVTRRGFTWNPTGGCLHGCTWQMPDGSVTQCYAKTVAEKFTRPFPQGFETHYWRGGKTLTDPLRQPSPSGIFVGSMADLFGHWVPADQIQQVLDVMRRADWHIFQTLSKNPTRLTEFGAFPRNVWVGVSLPARRSATGAARALAAYLRKLEEVNAVVRFMSIEPLWFDAAPVFRQHLKAYGHLPMEWAIIGAASNGRKLYQPLPEWVAGLHNILDEQRIPIFHKGNLKWHDHREDFPTHRITRYPDAVFDVDGVDAGAFDPVRTYTYPELIQKYFPDPAPWLDYQSAIDAMTRRSLYQMRMF